MVPPPSRPDLSTFPAPLTTAIAESETAIRRNPHDATARLKLGQIYHANGFNAEARQCYEPIVAHRPLGAKACYYLANLAELDGDLARESRWLSAALEHDRTYVPAHLLLAATQEKSGHATAAVEQFQAALKLQPANAEALVGLARARLQSGQDLEAEALLQKAAATRAASTANALLAQLADRRGDTSAATAYRTKSRAHKDPARNDPWLEELVGVCFDVQRLSLRFEDEVKSGGEEAALATLRRLETIAPEHWLVSRVRALAASQAGRETEAVAHYERALAAGGDPATLYPALIASLVDVQRYAEANTRAQAALKLLPDSPALTVAVANLRLAERKPDEAVQLLRQALTHDRENVAANRALATILWQQGQREAAMEPLEFVRRVAPADVPVRGMLGQYYLEHDDAARAIAPLAEAAANEPSDKDINGLLALAYLRAANQNARAQLFAEAVANYDRAIATQHDLVEAHANKIQVCAYAGWRDRAQQAVAALLALEPRDPAIFLKLGDVERALGNSAEATRFWRRAADLLREQPNAAVRDALTSRLQP